MAALWDSLCPGRPETIFHSKNEAYKIDLKFERISLHDIFEIDEHYEADMQRKAYILATRPADLVLPGVSRVSGAYTLCITVPDMAACRNCAHTLSLAAYCTGQTAVFEPYAS